jgi:hypothetical protein
MPPRNPASMCLGVVLLLTFSSSADPRFAATSDLRVTPGEFTIDHATLINLGFEWAIQGDENRNARVEVSYRKQGDAQWKQGMPLLRLQGERTDWTSASSWGRDAAERD